MSKYRLISLLFLLSPLSLLAQTPTWVNGQAARVLIGQATWAFGSLAMPNQSTLGAAGGVAYANGTLWVADATTMTGLNPNNGLPIPSGVTSGTYTQDARVLGFPTSSIPLPDTDLTPFAAETCSVCGFSANIVLGQTNFTTFAPGTSQSATSGTGSMNDPTGVASDGNRLAVADYGNNRVLLWNATPNSINAPPDIVLGQASFTTNSSSVTSATFRGPQGVWINPDGHVFVADAINNRVLIWNHFPTSNGQPADVVLGQTNFNTGTQPACNISVVGETVTTAANQLCNPTSVTSDGTRVYVADFGFNRVLIWNSIPSNDGQPADVVLGQPNMTTAIANNTSNNFCPDGNGPVSTITNTSSSGVVSTIVTGGQCNTNLDQPSFAVADAASNQLFVADTGNGRVLVYSPIPTTSGVAASAVLGQPSFVAQVNSSQSTSIASTQINNIAAVDVVPAPTSVAYDPVTRNLFVADPTNNRVLVFTPGQSPLPLNSILNWASGIIRQEGVVTFSAGPSSTTPVANDTTTVTISGTNYTYTIKKGDTFDSIAQGEVSAINSSNSGAGDPNAFATFSGSRTGSLYLSSKGVNLPFDSISLAATTSNSNNEVASTSGNYLSSGTGATGSPGMLVEINGTNLSDAQNPVMAPMSGNIPTTLGGAQVYFNGVAAPVFQAQSNQIISQVPYAVGQNLTTSASVFVRTVHTDGSVTVTNASPLYIANANPGIFSSPSTPNQPRPWPAMNAFHQPGNPNAVVSIDGTITAGNTATITVAGRAYNYTVQGSDSTRSVAQGLANLINSAPDPNVTASLGGAFARVILTAIQSGAAGTGISVAGSTSSGATITVTAYTGSTCCNVTPNSAISPSNPAADGELITISTAGLGLLMDPATSAGIIPNTGQPYNGVVPNVVQNNAIVSATMGGSTAEVINAGLPTGSYGVYQVQLIVPSNLGVNSNTELTIAQNAFVSNTVTVPVGNAVPNAPAPVPTTSTPTITSSLDTPSPQGGDFSGTINVGGWAVDSRNAISSVAIYVDGNFAGYAVYGGPRNDVCAVYPSSIGCPNVGFNGPLDTTQLPDGTHAISAITTDSAGNQFTSSNTFTTSNFSGRPSSFTIFADQPGPQSGPFQGEARFSGWAFNKNSPVLPSGVSVYIDGQQQPGTATYGLSRADVCSAYGNEPGCPNIGWSYLVDTGQLSNGTHTFVVKVVAANGQYAFQSNSFTVANWTTANPITVDIDSPSAQGGALSGTQVFGGWAVDTSAPIYDVLISIDGVPYGSGNYGVSRSDACAATQNPPGCPNVGWNVGVDTTLLGDGSHVLAVSAIPLSGTGLTVTRQFTVSNNSAAQSTISIDLPGSPSTVLTGTAHVAGWAVNSTAAVASVEVIVDGVSKGFATYGGTRSDVCAVVGNFPGCPNVGWNFGLDTSTLTNGSHLLTVTVTTAAGARSSQNASFMVSNTLPAGPTVVTITQPASTSNPFQGFANFSGRASSTSSQIQSVSITIDGAPYGTATPVQGSFANGWTFLLNTAQLADGGHTLGATVVAADGTFNIASAPFTVANWSDPNAMIINIDNPSSSSGPLSGEYHIGGWIVDQNAAISTVSVSVDGIPFGNASYGGARSDVCAVYPNYPGCPDVGWNAGLDTALLANGTHTLAITGTTVNGQSSTTTTTFTVSN